MENMEENNEKIWNIWKKDKLNSEIILLIVIRYGQYGGMAS